MLLYEIYPPNIYKHSTDIYSYKIMYIWCIVYFGSSVKHILCIAYNCYMIDNILNSISIAEYRATYVYFD